jgi:serine palmitoyltransferase
MCYAESMSPAVLAQVLASMSSIMGVSPPLTAAPSSPTPVASSSTHLIPPIPFHQSASDTDLSLMYGGSGSASIAGQSDDEEEWAAVYGPAPSSSLPSWLSLPPSLLNGTEGRERLRRLAFNSRYLSSGLRKLGFIVYGSRDSPIVPLLLFQPAKMPLFSRMMLERIGVDKTPIVVVVVAYP